MLAGYMLENSDSVHPSWEELIYPNAKFISKKSFFLIMAAIFLTRLFVSLGLWSP